MIEGVIMKQIGPPGPPKPTRVKEIVMVSVMEIPIWVSGP
jgi:hypothetical protein